MLGPSTPCPLLVGCVKDIDGETVNNATCVGSITTGARYAKTISSKLVKRRSGARYWLIALESPAIMLGNVENVR